MNSSDWPAVAFEARPWNSRIDQPMSRRARLASRGPYRAAVLPPIEIAVPRIDPDVAAAADDAGRELARFDAEAGHIAAPFASILLRTESASSSEIERITSSAKQIALAELGASRAPNANLVLANVRAMNAALDLAEHLDDVAIIGMHRTLLAESAPSILGGWRGEQVWIGGGGFSPHQATFVPPHHDRVPALMADLTAFLRRTDLPVIVHAALAHAQFETIHPFPDGNGRTGRALVQGMLRAGGVTRNVAIPVSAGLLARVDDYFAALTAYRDGDPSPIVARLADASFRAIDNGRILVDALASTRARWLDVTRARQGSAARRLLDLLLRQPVVGVPETARWLDVSTVAARNAVLRLEDAGVLTRANSGARNRLWQANDVLDALDAFATRARRATPPGR